MRNAVTFSPAGAAIRVEVSFGRAGPAIQVVDQGAGIPAHELPHVAERFYRGRYAREQAVAGVGLGLSIARAVAVAHGGSLTVTSAGPGHGTTARLSLRPDPVA